MGLRDERPALVLEPLDDPQLPQRLGAVQALGEDARRRAAAARSSSPGRGSAVWRTWYSRLKRGSSIQRWRPKPPGGDGELLAVARHEVQAAADVLEHVGVRRRRARRSVAIAPMCMCVASPSWCRNAASIALSRSRCCCAMPAASILAPDMSDPSKAVLDHRLLDRASGGRRRAPGRPRLDGLRDRAPRRVDRRPRGGGLPHARARRHRRGVDAGRGRRRGRPSMARSACCQQRRLLAVGRGRERADGRRCAGSSRPTCSGSCG